MGLIRQVADQLNNPTTLIFFHLVKQSVALYKLKKKSKDYYMCDIKEKKIKKVNFSFSLNEFVCVAWMMKSKTAWFQFKI